MPDLARPLAGVTGASTGIGRELAILCAKRRSDLVIAADDPEIRAAADEIRALGANAEPVRADLATAAGVRALPTRCEGREVELLSNAGHRLGGALLHQDFDAVRHVASTNVTGTLLLVHRLARGMRGRGHGRFPFAGSIAGDVPVRPRRSTTAPRPSPEAETVADSQDAMAPRYAEEGGRRPA